MDMVIDSHGVNTLFMFDGSPMMLLYEGYAAMNDFNPSFLLFSLIYQDEMNMQ